jgi:hypothetical protein
VSDDLVQRLRQLAAMQHSDFTIGEEAADEIERLQAWADAQKAPQPRTAEPTGADWVDKNVSGNPALMQAMRNHAEPAPAPADEPPLLPEPAHGFYGAPMYTADQMRARDDYWIAKLQAARAASPVPAEPQQITAERVTRTAEPALSMKRHEWDSLSPEAKRLIHDRTREHTLESARAAQAIRDVPLAEPAPAPADEPPPLPEPAWMTQLCGRDPHYFYTADQMRAYRSQPPTPQPPQGAQQEPPPADPAFQLPPAYMLAKLAMVVPLLQEARDALCALREDQRVRHGIAKNLADRMDAAGTYSLDDWQAAQGLQEGETR